ncbi:MAG TPA: hypothetical protein VNV66_20490, partial [Pilimelia sp.]|nr:hypothetical protein [Pilimelia sp.]
RDGRPAPRGAAVAATVATGSQGRPSRARLYPALLGTVGVVVLLAICGLSSWMIVLDERKGRDARAAAPPGPTVQPRDITSRLVDPAPLTAKEVFPQAQIVINPAEPPYRVLKTQVAKDCRVAAAGQIGALMVDLGCNQVVRATLRSPNGAYLVTGGIFNLEDRAGAEFAQEKIQPIVNAGKGRFSGMVAGKGTEPIATSAAHVGWDIRGHYLIYCVIARADGKAFAKADPFARQILYDIVELHLRDKVLEKRATMPIGGPAPAAGR